MANESTVRPVLKLTNDVFQIPLNISDTGNSSHCPTQMPQLQDFVTNITPTFMAFLVVATCVTLTTIFLFWRQFAQLKKQTPKQFLSHTVILCGLYQVRKENHY